MLRPFLMLTGVSLDKCFLSVYHSLSPSVVGAVAAQWYRDHISNRPAKQDESGGGFCDRVDGITVGQYSLLESVGIQ